MLQSDRVKEFIEKVCGQINAKSAHGAIATEIMAHIEDQKLMYIKEGMNENTAEEKAIKEIGDPLTLGESLNQIHRPKHDWIGIAANIIMWIIAGSITVLGIFLGVAVLLSLIRTGDYIVGVIICLGLILFFMFLAFIFVSIYKMISNLLFYRGLYIDYKRRKNRGEWKLWNSK